MSSGEDSTGTTSSGALANTGEYVQCEHCSHHIKRRNYAHHVRYNHCKRQYQCDKCSKAFAYPSYLRIHEISHLSDKECQLCELSFRNISQLARHLKTHRTTQVIQDGFNYQCARCKQLFKKQEDFKCHRAEHDSILLKTEESDSFLTDQTQNSVLQPFELTSTAPKELVNNEEDQEDCSDDEKPVLQHYKSKAVFENKEHVQRHIDAACSLLSLSGQTQYPNFDQKLVSVNSNGLNKGPYLFFLPRIIQS